MFTSKSEEKIITAYEVVQKRQSQLLTESHDLDLEEAQIRERLIAIQNRRKEIIIEHQVLEAGMHENGRLVYNENHITINLNDGRKVQSDRINIDQALRTIFQTAGTPLPMRIIIKELEEIGFRWNRYVTAHGYISRHHSIVSTGARGYYNYCRS
jgi:regulator of replication initiation timing